MEDSQRWNQWIDNYKEYPNYLLFHQRTAKANMIEYHFQNHKVKK